MTQKNITSDVVENNNNSIVRYSDDALLEFKELITKKMNSAHDEYNFYQEQIKASSTNDDDSRYTGLEDGSGTMEKEYLNQMASRELQYIKHLEAALARIENKTYGICRITGKLISKERLKVVPHATLSIEAKLSRK